MDPSLHTFLHPHSPYQGAVNINALEPLAFNANLQEFAQRVGYISSLHTGGKLSSETAFQQMTQLWTDLSRSQQGLSSGRLED